MLNEYENKQIKTNELINILKMGKEELTKSIFIDSNWDRDIVLTKGIITIIKNELNS